MKVAVVGKGGSGKTTTSAVLARTFARSGLATLALDCDTNPNLGLSLGYGEEATEKLVGVGQALDTGEEGHAGSMIELIDRFGVDGPDGVRLAIVSAIENPEPGCPCCGVSPERLLVSEAVESVVVPGSEGYFTVLARHAPFMTTLKPGLVEVTGGAGGARKIFVRGGFADVTPAGLTILADQAIAAEDLDAAAFAEQIRVAEADVSAAGEDPARLLSATSKLDELRNLQRWILPA